jgi:hypothetical protein
MNVLTSFLYAFSFWNGSVALKKEGMQNDTHTLEAFHALNEKEHDKIKTIHAMLERRMHYRQTIAKHSADAPALPPEMFDKKKKRPQNDSGVVINTSKEYNKAYHDQGQIKFVDNQKQQQEQNESQVQPEQEQNREKKKKEGTLCCIIS